MEGTVHDGVRSHDKVGGLGRRAYYVCLPVHPVSGGGMLLIDHEVAGTLWNTEPQAVAPRDLNNFYDIATSLDEEELGDCGSDSLAAFIPLRSQNSPTFSTFPLVLNRLSTSASILQPQGAQESTRRTTYIRAQPI